MSAQQNDGSPDTGSVYVWLSRDADGIEGVIVYPLDVGVVPLVFTDAERAQRLGTEPARIAAAARGHPARLVRFERAETVTEVGS